MNADATARVGKSAVSGKYAARTAAALLLLIAPTLGQGTAEAQGFFQWWEEPPPRPPMMITPARPPRPHKPKTAIKPPVWSPAAAGKPSDLPVTPLAQPTLSARKAAVPSSATTAPPPRDGELAGIPLDASWPKQLYVIGDSVMLGAKPYLVKAFPDWQVTFAGRPSLMLRKAIDELPPGSLGSVVIVALGYNSSWQRDRENYQFWADKFDKNIEDMLAALKQRGARKVVWVLLRELTPELSAGLALPYQQQSWYFPYVNERLRAAKERHPDLALADWVTAARQSGITYDAIHLNPRGADLMVNVVRVAVGLDALPTRVAASPPVADVEKAPKAVPVPASVPATPPRQEVAASPPTEEPELKPQELAAAAAPIERPAAEIRKSLSETGTIPPRVPLKASYAFRDCASCPEMVILPADSFMMGSPDNESDRDAVEGPQRLVAIDRPFAVGQFEVTFAEWDACVADGGCQSNPNPKDEGWGKDKQPVVNVSWEDAVEYVTWLSRTTGKTYRLLSEAEWEYAARAGSSSPFPEGGAITPEQANFQATFDGDGSNREGKYREQPVPVGSFAPNAFGLHDMEGNVSEWVQDTWHETYAGAPTDGSVWAGGDTSLRVLRGGSWYSFPTDLRSASRRADQPDHRSPEIGFRVARSL